MLPGAPAVVPPGSQPAPAAPYFTIQLNSALSTRWSTNRLSNFNNNFSNSSSSESSRRTTKMDEIEQTTDFKNHTLPLNCKGKEDNEG
ncbi:hypothetical protein E2562_027966 [Oryza meyeriana var. granulata]|uniref:Uncharacterized protein n=1 Tax=Oryza meyeriana var. granulata TaxID=110450 RepID=A0A6G1CTY8_9ORYZ|nr:hypothetical protein E2562_027966 [Oryza meyeriana var. granulata]